MGLFTRGKVYISADRNTYLEYDQGTGLVTLYVDGVAVFTASNAALTFLAETGAGETITGTITAANIHVQTAAVMAGTVEMRGATTQSGVFNAMTTARLLGNNQIGASTASLIGAYGYAPIAQPTATGQGIVGTGAASAGLMVTATSISTTGVVAGFQSLDQVTALLTNVNNLASYANAHGTLTHAIRTALVGLGWIKGAI